jgi:hypothetical protein
LDVTKLVAEFPCVGINRLLRLAEPRYMMISDKDVLAAEAQRLRTSTCTILLFKGLAPYARRELPGRRLFLWDVRPRRGPFRLRPGQKPKGFLYSGNSSTYAIEAAALMGATEIRMVGIDLFYPRVGPTHFFGDGRKEGCRLSSPERVVEAVRCLNRELKAKGITLVNESPASGPLDGVVPRRSCPWLITPTPKT